MNLFTGIKYNLRGLILGIKTPKLLFWGCVRFAAVILLTVVFAWLILAYHQALVDMIWSRPETWWLLWLWHILSWLISLMLLGISIVFSYLISQILFSVIIMDHMSRVTELMLTGRVKEPERLPAMKLALYLMKQEIPRAVLPVGLSFMVMLAGWFTPLAPVTTTLSSGVALIFLSWDSTDLVPARRLRPFASRFRFLLKTIPFHLGFGLPFLIPLLNMLFLSFAPVGATLYYIEKHDVTGGVAPA